MYRLVQGEDVQYCSRPSPVGVLIYGRSAVCVAHIQPIVALIAGVLILLAPYLLNYIVAFYLIIVGVVGLGLLH
jgi:hypothetical protein